MHYNRNTSNLVQLHSIKYHHLAVKNKFCIDVHQTTLLALLRCWRNKHGNKGALLLTSASVWYSGCTQQITTTVPKYHTQVCPKYQRCSWWRNQGPYSAGHPRHFGSAEYGPRSKVTPCQPWMVDGRRAVPQKQAAWWDWETELKMSLFLPCKHRNLGIHARLIINRAFWLL